jgi:hypothetical protein
VLAVADGDALAFAVLVGLGPVHGHDDATGLEVDVAHGEGGEFGAAQRGGEAEQMIAVSRAAWGWCGRWRRR